ncbi:hypothetical protein BDW74DRAFT_189671 [Aspergillus multicolor]|uniref:uncharacterized protein n=1 Tax=Aspergillus multicolor TaxID=41759 RepID=UPI003CCE0EF1
MAPSDLSIRNLTGDWAIDKSKSKNIDGALKLQGIGWLRRKAVTSGTITLKTTYDTNSNSLMMQQGLRGIFPGVEQTRLLDWSEHEHVDAVSGAAIKVRSRFVRGVVEGEKVKPVLQVETNTAKKAEVETYLTAAVSIPVPAGQVGDGDEEKSFVQDFIVCEGGGWTAEQIWAVEKIGDGLFLTCRAVAAKGDTIEQAYQVYQYEEQK